MVDPNFGNDHPITTADTLFELIEAIKNSDGAGVTDLANRLDKPTSTVHDHLMALTRTEYIVNKNGEYRLSTRFIDLAHCVQEQMDLYEIAKPEVDRLARTTGEHSNLMIEEHGYGVFLYKNEGENAVQLDTYPGMRVPLHMTALGKAIMAHMTEEEIHSIVQSKGLPEATEKTITDQETLQEELADIRQDEYAFDDEERAKGMQCLAVPLQTEDSSILGAISVSATKERMENQKFRDEVKEELRQSANTIEVNANFNGLSPDQT